MSRAEIARENFMRGKTCAGAVLLAFSDLTGLDEKTAEDISLPFGGGFARLRLTCGAVSGMAMTFGVIVGRSQKPLSKNEMYAAVQELSARFQKKNGSILCGKLLSGHGIRCDTSPSSEERTEEYYKKRPCPALCFDGAEILENYLIEKGYIKSGSDSLSE
jgi:C_GCAxxG_C_C family probable redox protein